MAKVAIIVQRYGLEVNGGAEYHARILAEQLAKIYHINILTTTALDYHGWENHYLPGEDLINNISVLRFQTMPQSEKKKRRIGRAMRGQKKYFKILRKLGIYNFLNKKLDLTKLTKRDMRNWLEAQGPYCPGLIDYIKKNKKEYDIFIFFTYLYYPTVIGMPLVAEKSIFIPTAHDEPPLYTQPYKHLFSVPKFIMYNTESERNLIESHFPDAVNNADIAGVGIDAYTINYEQVDDKYHYQDPYFVYIGRIEENKGCKELIDFFTHYTQQNPAAKLVLIGKDHLNIQPTNNIILTGFIPDNDKYYILSRARALINPSLYESLSLVLLEAMSIGVPVIANGNCEVLKNHITNSDAGYYYTDRGSFMTALEQAYTLSEPERQKMALAGKKYVAENYSWNTILEKFKRAIDGMRTKH